MLKNRFSHSLTAASLVIAAGLASPTASADTPLDPSGATIAFSGAFEEFLVPDLLGSVWTFTVYGADGGAAQVANNGSCFNAGGDGATATIDAVVGDGAFDMEPGRPIRFIVGGQGEDAINLQANRSEAAGGGGGSAVAYRSTVVNVDEGWRLLAVAGGGGGAFARVVFGVCTDPDQEGQNAGTGECGSTGNRGGGAGGCDGNTGVRAPGAAGGGGGWISTSQFETGGRAGGRSNPTGGAGGGGRRAGGFGFGGGGGSLVAGGGGGGYSGGGGGGTGGGNGGSGGGGGSFVNSDYAFSVNSVVTGSPVGSNGRIDYAITGQIHDERETGLPIEVDEDGLGEIIGSTIGANISALPSVPAIGADVWYAYTNLTAPCGQRIILDWPANEGIQVVAVPSGAPPFADTDGSLNVTVFAGQTVEFRISSPQPTFTIDVLVLEVGDSDGDGACDEFDICPGVDDGTLDPADDIDGDGIHDVCDQLCPEDLWPDGVIDVLDVQAYSLLFFPGVSSPIDPDLDGSGTVDFFDWLEVIDGCE